MVWSVLICCAAWSEIVGLGHLGWLQGWRGGSFRVAVACDKTAPGDSPSLTDNRNSYQSCPCTHPHEHALPSSVLALAIAWLHPELNLHCMWEQACLGRGVGKGARGHFSVSQETVAVCNRSGTPRMWGHLLWHCCAGAPKATCSDLSNSQGDNCCTYWLMIKSGVSV